MWAAGRLCDALFMQHRSTFSLKYIEPIARLHLQEFEKRLNEFRISFSFFLSLALPLALSVLATDQLYTIHQVGYRLAPVYFHSSSNHRNSKSTNCSFRRRRNKITLTFVCCYGSKRGRRAVNKTTQQPRWINAVHDRYTRQPAMLHVYIRNTLIRGRWPGPS